MQQSAHEKVGALLHVGLETQCTPTPRTHKNGPLLSATTNYKHDICLTVRIAPKTKLVSSVFNVELASKGCALSASYLPVSDETMLNNHLCIL